MTYEVGKPWETRVPDPVDLDPDLAWTISALQRFRETVRGMKPYMAHHHTLEGSVSEYMASAPNYRYTATNEQETHPMPELKTNPTTEADLAAAKADLEKARAKRNRAQEKVAAAEAWVLEVNNALARQSWPSEPSHHAGVLGGRRLPAVVTFDRRIGGKSYTYSAVRPVPAYGYSPGQSQWYITGEITTPFTWSHLLEWMGEHGRATLVTAQRWGRTK